MTTLTSSMASAAPEKCEWSNVSTVTLIVGGTRAPFHVHETVLCKASPVFKAAFGSAFKEGLDRKMTLPDDDAELFNLLVEWLYTSHYILPQPTGDRIKDGYRFMKPIQLYILADKYGVTGLKNSIAKAMFNAMKQNDTVGPNLDTVAYVYQDGPTILGIRNLLADFYACTIKFCWSDYEGARNFRDFLRTYPEFAADVLLSRVEYFSKNSMRKSFNSGRVEAYLEPERATR